MKLKDLFAELCAGVYVKRKAWKGYWRYKFGKIELVQGQPCKWLGDFSGVCCNSYSNECASFPSKEDCTKCNHYEVKNE